MGAPPLVGKPAPAIDLADLDGRRVRLADYAGRPVVVNFWASWCIPCRTEFPMFRSARDRHGAQGLEILGVVHDDAADAARAFASERSAAWPMLLDPEDRAWHDYGALSLPTTYFVDRAGVVRLVSYGPPSSSAVFEEHLAQILSPIG